MLPYTDPTPLSPTHVAGLHLNFFPMLPQVGPSMFIEGKIVGMVDSLASKARATKAGPLDKLLETGYWHQQGTYPETLGQGLADSPVGTMAWVVEKYGKWSDP